MKEEEIKEEIKEIIYGCAKKGGMCDDFSDGQIIGLRTGKDLELDMVANGIAQWYLDKKEASHQEELKGLLERVEGIKVDPGYEYGYDRTKKEVVDIIRELIKK